MIPAGLEAWLPAPFPIETEVEKNMRSSFKLLYLLLCVSLLLSPALAEGNENQLSAYEAGLPPLEGETLIQPAYPVPDHVLWLLDVARGEIGYTEEHGGVTKYGTWAGYPSAEWCAEFQCWCVNQVDKLHGTRLLNREYPNYSGTNVGRDWFISQGRYIARTGFLPGYGTQWWIDTGAAIEKNSYVPQPGDWVFLTDNASGDTSHVAMVEYCAADASGKVRVHVIEGNNVTKPAPQGVERNDYALDYWRILGYGTVRDLADVTLKFGHSGPKVKALQTELVQAGLLEEKYTTGKYGAITTGCIKTVQQKYGIQETGIANLETRMALRRMIGELSAR